MLITGVLSGLQRDWQLKQLPKLQLQAHKVWHQSHATDQTSIWRGDVEHTQQLMLKLVHQVSATHSAKAIPAFKAIKKSCRNIATTFENLQELLFKLGIAALPEAPAKPARSNAVNKDR